MLKKQLLFLSFTFLFLCLDQPVMGGPKKQPPPGLLDDSRPITTATQQQHRAAHTAKKRKRPAAKQPLPKGQTQISSYFAASESPPSSSIPSKPSLPLMENEEEDDSLLLELDGDNGAEVPPLLAGSEEEDDDGEDLLSALQAEVFPATLPKRSRLQHSHLASLPSSAAAAQEPERVIFGYCPPPYSRAMITTKDDSDTEDDPSTLETIPSTTVLPSFPTDVIRMGMQIKLLANVYLKKLDQTANIFIPFFTLTDSRDSVKRQDFFRTPRGEICVFASGGFQNAWESTVASVQRIFFGNKVKIIRASWIQKHLSQSKRIEKDLEQEYRGRESELHSELYYDLFFEHFFLSSLLEKLGEEKTNPLNLKIHAFSWWDVCNTCERRLTAHHRDLLPSNMRLFYQVAGMRRYSHIYPRDTFIQEARIPLSEEDRAWTQIWAKVSEYARKEFESAEDKEVFWTETKDGLELCKWLGQAFEENTRTIGERSSSPCKKGDILKFYKTMTGEDTRELAQLLEYLRDVNWDLSCWYKTPYPFGVQRPWKKYWRQVVIPHFNWEEIKESKVMEESDELPHCEMCGHESLRQVFYVFHPKYRVSGGFLSLSKEEQAMSERSSGYSRTATIHLPLSLKKKRRDWLKVGSECVQTLVTTHEKLIEWERKHPREERDRKWRDLDERQALDEAREKAERELREKRKSVKRKNKSSTGRS